MKKHEKTKFKCTWSFIGGMEMVSNFKAVRDISSCQRPPQSWLRFDRRSWSFWFESSLLQMRRWRRLCWRRKMTRMLILTWMTLVDDVDLLSGVPLALVHWGNWPFRNPNKPMGSSHENENGRWSSSALPQRVLNPATFARLGGWPIWGWTSHA